MTPTPPQCPAPPPQGAPRLLTLIDGNSITIRVIDAGIGIAAQHIPRLTEPFYRVDPSRQRETGGYGLGLYLCRMIAEAHDGRLVIESVRGEGTTISVCLLAQEKRICYLDYPALAAASMPGRYCTATHRRYPGL